jgi:hypothetical protein
MSVTRLLAKKISAYDNPRSIASILRKKRIALFLDMVEAVFKENAAVSILDVGGTQAYWNIVPMQFLEEHNARITIINLPGQAMPEDHGPFIFIAADGCDLSFFGDKSFQIGHSNSVVEHVGDWKRMVLFANELSRVSQYIFVQTPNYWFPIEPHCMTPFFHWLPRPIQVWLVLHFQLGHWEKASTVRQAVETVESARMLDKAMFQELFKDSDILTERILGFAKSFIAVKK